jgi:putative transposase
MSRSRYRILEIDQPHFLTCTAVGWLPVFTFPETAQIVLDSWRHLQKRRGWVIYGYVILENHLHLVAFAPDLVNDLGDFKSYTARRIIDFLQQRGARTLLSQLRMMKLPHKTDRTYQLWQEGSHPQAILDEEMLRQKLEYIHNNPVRRGYVDEPAHWRYSSARDYEGRSGLLTVQTDWWQDEAPGGSSGVAAERPKAVPTRSVGTRSLRG